MRSSFPSRESITSFLVISLQPPKGENSLDDGVDVLKPAAFERQAAQLLPPGLEQIQPAGLRWVNRMATAGHAINAVCVSREICGLR
jgi:hypothetical protein